MEYEKEATILENEDQMDAETYNRGSQYDLVLKSDLLIYKCTIILPHWYVVCQTLRTVLTAQ